jgi:hypothetical protein
MNFFPVGGTSTLGTHVVKTGLRGEFFKRGLDKYLEHR